MNRLLLALLAFLAGPALADSPLPDGPAFDGWVRDSSFIFEGTVRQVGASTVKSVSPSQNPAIVQVEDSLFGATSAFAGLKQVTILPKEALHVGERLVFFTQSAIFGEGVAVSELGRVGPGKGLRARVAAAQQRNQRSSLARRLAASDLVVSGTVAAVAGGPESKVISEHDPKWQRATIVIAAVLKGDKTLKKVDVFFAASDDVAWVKSRRYKVGDKGVWILQPAATGLLAPGGHTTPDELDFQPEARLEDLRSLIATPSKDL